jgi:hypothetical protein
MTFKEWLIDEAHSEEVDIHFKDYPGHVYEVTPKFDGRIGGVLYCKTCDIPLTAVGPELAIIATKRFRPNGTSLKAYEYDRIKQFDEAAEKKGHIKYELVKARDRARKKNNNAIDHNPITGDLTADDGSRAAQVKMPSPYNHIVPGKDWNLLSDDKHAVMKGECPPIDCIPPRERTNDIVQAKARADLLANKSSIDEIMAMFK